MKPCSQQETYMKRSSNEITKSVIIAGIDSLNQPSTSTTGNCTALSSFNSPVCCRPRHMCPGDNLTEFIWMWKMAEPIAEQAKP